MTLSSPDTARCAHIVWFRDDLRLADNPALTHAAGCGAPIIALYILEEGPDIRPLGGAARWWLHGSLEALREDLHRFGIPLMLRRGRASACLCAAIRQTGASAVSWNRRAAAPARTGDATIRRTLEADGIVVGDFKANVLFEGNELLNSSGRGFRVFSAFWRAARARPPGRPLPAPQRLTGWSGSAISDGLDSWKLRPSAPDWAIHFDDMWMPGESRAHDRLQDFADNLLDDYARKRDFPAHAATSMLSPRLRFGEITPRQVWHVIEMATRDRPGAQAGGDKYLCEIGWREFSHHLLDHFPELARRNFNPAFDRFPWRHDADALSRWQRGQTGYPIIDAGMRELWATGWMHNRVRMVAASFLTKHLLIDWRQGEAWFWDTLVDADAANNPAAWQWVAGSGADAAPYFRIFNPVLHGEKFDTDGTYTRHWVPELRDLPNRWLHKPWQAPASVLNATGVRLGQTYSTPLVEHAAARARALDAYKAMKQPQQ